MAHLTAPSLPSPTSRPGSSYSGINIASTPSSPPDHTDRRSRRYPPFSSSGSGSDPDSDSDSSALPFPTALPRRDFLSADFDAAAYLSALHSGGPAARHQTLGDLRTELRERSAAASAELLSLVNANYAAFLGLGDGLRGGEDRVEGLRVALLGFRRAVAELLARVAERRKGVAALAGELARVRAAVELGRRMVELDDRVAVLEDRLAVGGYGAATRKAGVVGGGGEHDGGGWGEVESSDEEDDEEDDEDEDEDDGEGFGGSSPAKLTALVMDYLAAEELADAIGRDMPFVKKMDERTTKCRSTILLDLGTALREARKAGAKGHTRLVKLLGIYRVLDADVEAVRVLKGK